MPVNHDFHPSLNGIENQTVGMLFSQSSESKGTSSAYPYRCLRSRGQTWTSDTESMGKISCFLASVHIASLLLKTQRDGNNRVSISFKISVEAIPHLNLVLSPLNLCNIDIPAIGEYLMFGNVAPLFSTTVIEFWEILVYDFPKKLSLSALDSKRRFLLTMSTPCVASAVNVFFQCCRVSVNVVSRVEKTSCDSCKDIAIHTSVTRDFSIHLSNLASANRWVNIWPSAFNANSGLKDFNPCIWCSILTY